MSKAGISVTDKATKESSRNEAVDLGLKLQSGKLLQLPWEMMMMKMVPHDHNLHRPLQSNAIGYGDVDAYGPTVNNNNSSSSNSRPCNNKTSNIYDVLCSSSSSDYGSSAASAISNGGGLSSVQQPFDISLATNSTVTVHTAFKSPGEMAASFEFPFTRAQWKELQRQAMIYKYMKASLPEPFDLVIPFTGNPSVPVGGAALNLRFSGRGDAEPGRCRRTDGKKWRCSRDVAPDQKYCERHMHRGRPRSRKPVERPNKKTGRHNHHHTQPLPSSSSDTKINASPPFWPSEKPTTFWPVNSVSPYKELLPRNSEWIMNELIALPSSDQQWFHLNSSVVNHNYNEEPLSLNSYANFCAFGNQQRIGFPLFANSEIASLEKTPEDTPRGFIDAWSTGISGDHNTDNCRAETSVSSNGQLSLSSLSLSMGVDNTWNESDQKIQNHAYATSKSHLSSWLAPASWAASTAPGGPLAEVLRPSKSTTAADGSSNPSSPVTVYGSSCSPTVTAVSSPSGVLHRTFASFSDSSSCSSPTLATSGAKTDIGLMWLKGN